VSSSVLFTTRTPWNFQSVSLKSQVTPFGPAPGRPKRTSLPGRGRRPVGGAFS
jgi:hypothetical protein